MGKTLLSETKRLIEKYKRNYCDRKYEASDLICDMQNKQHKAALDFIRALKNTYSIRDIKNILRIHEEIYGNYKNVGIARPINRVLKPEHERNNYKK
jgi:hypothetical protein